MKGNDVDREQNVRTDLGATTSTLSTTNPTEEVDSSTAISKPVKSEAKTSLSGLNISDDSTSNATQSNSIATSPEPRSVTSTRTSKTRILPVWLKTMASNTSSTVEEKPVPKKRSTRPPPLKKSSSAKSGL